MRIKLGSGLIQIIILVIILVSAITFFPSNILRIILGIPFLLFFPGYTLMAALFTKKEGLSSIERVVLSTILSIAIVSLLGFICNYTPWGINLEPILYSATSFIFITSLIAWLRRSRLASHERFSIEFQMTIPSLDTRRDKVLAITLMIAILGTLAALSYFIIETPKVEETFTDFYILGPEGVAANYTMELKSGELAKVTAGIINHERKEISYRVEVVIDGKKSTEVGPMILANEQKWEGEIDYVPETPAADQKVEFRLYKDDEAKPSLEPLYLRVDVSENESVSENASVNDNTSVSENISK